MPISLMIFCRSTNFPGCTTRTPSRGSSTPSRSWSSASPRRSRSPTPPSSGVLRDIRNHKTAIDLVRAEARNKKLKLNLTTLKKLYETLYERHREQGAVRVAQGHAAPPELLPRDRPAGQDRSAAHKVFEATETADFRNAHAIQRAARLHHGLMQVFPYTDNSGGGAALANLYLIQAGYLPVIHATDRQRYYESFRQPEGACAS